MAEAVDQALVGTSPAMAPAIVSLAPLLAEAALAPATLSAFIDQLPELERRAGGPHFGGPIDPASPRRQGWGGRGRTTGGAKAPRGAYSTTIDPLIPKVV